MALPIQSDDIFTKPTIKNIPHDKVIIQIRKRDQEFYRQAKATGVQYHQTSFTRNVKGTSLSGKENVRTRNIKILKEKISLVKANIQPR